jgi:hypothetical protein
MAGFRRRSVEALPPLRQLVPEWGAAVLGASVGAWFACHQLREPKQEYQSKWEQRPRERGQVGLQGGERQVPQGRPLQQRVQVQVQVQAMPGGAQRVPQ